MNFIFISMGCKNKIKAYSPISVMPSWNTKNEELYTSSNLLELIWLFPAKLWSCKIHKKEINNTTKQIQPSVNKSCLLCKNKFEVLLSNRKNRWYAIDKTEDKC